MGGEPVFDAEFLRFLGQLGVGGAIAGILFFFYRKDVRSYTDLWQAQSKINSEQTSLMIQIVRDNTAATVTNTEVLRALHRRVDQLDMLRVFDDHKDPDPNQRRP
jgi:hypothetical protein